LPLGLILWAGCTESAPDPVPESDPATGTAVVDAAGVEHSTLERPTRIISLVPSATETLVRIGASAELVARTDFDDLEAVRSLPSIGMGLQPNLEAILSHAPDLVVYFHGESDEATPRRLREAGIRAFGIRPDRIEDVREIVTDLGALTHREEQAAQLLAEMDDGLRDIADRVAGRPTVRTVFAMGGEPPWVAGPGSYVDELIRAAGGENVFADVEALYGPVSVEAFLVRDIEVVLAGPAAQFPETIEQLGIARLPDFIDLPGPRLHEAAEAVARALHPEAFR